MQSNGGSIGPIGEKPLFIEHAWLTNGSFRSEPISPNRPIVGVLRKMSVIEQDQKEQSF